MEWKENSIANKLLLVYAQVSIYLFANETNLQLGNQDKNKHNSQKGLVKKIKNIHGLMNIAKVSLFL